MCSMYPVTQVLKSWEMSGLVDKGLKKMTWKVLNLSLPFATSMSPRSMS